jgi:hypothetical protein
MDFGTNKKSVEIKYEAKLSKEMHHSWYTESGRKVRLKLMCNVYLAARRSIRFSGLMSLP